MRITLFYFFIIMLTSTISVAYSATIKVDATNASCNDNIDVTNKPICSIQAAIDSASHKDIIIIPTGRYFENIVVDKHVSLIGEIPIGNASLVIIDGSKKGTVATISPGSKVSIKNIQLTNGKSDNGGGVHNQGSLMLSNSEVTMNIANHSGGGIFNAGSLTGSLYIDKSEITYNKALGDDKYNVKYGGGGIYNNAPINISNSEISNNFSQDNGGGIYSVFSGRKRPSKSEIIAEEIGLSAAPKRMNSLTRKADTGSVTIRKTKIHHNVAGSGGGINLQGVMNIISSTIDSNQAINHKRSSGGGIFGHFDTTLHIDNSTISHNEAIFRGAGVRFYSTKSGNMSNTSIIYNNLTKPIGQGGGLYIENHTKQFNIQNSLIAENTIMKKTGSDCYGKINSKGFNFIGIKNRCEWKRNGGDIIGDESKENPKIRWNDKQMRYYIDSDSPLINAVSAKRCNDSKGNNLKTDQYGKARMDEKCDIGSVEF